MNSAFRLPPSAFVLGGPTAVGKSEIAVELAERLGAEILNADAFQLYAGLDLLTAKPAAAALRRVPHHLIGAFPLSEPLSVARYLEAARGVVEEIVSRGRRVVVVGGTGLYVRALLHGLEPGPAPDPELRDQIAALPSDDTLACLREEDPAAFERVDRANPRRVQRALESARLRGRSVPSKLLPGIFAQELASPAGVFLFRDRADLHGRIAQRTAEMFARGLLDEVATIDPATVGSTAIQMIGWRECLACLRGEITKDVTRARIEAGTRQYAKRQITWFKREPALEAHALVAATSAGQAASEIARRFAGVSF